MIKRKPKPCLICSKPVYKVGAKVCSVNCSLEYNARNPDKVKSFVDELKKKREREQKRIEASEKQALKVKYKTLGQYEAEAKATFQKWVRMRDEKLNCISCNYWANRFDGGHYFKAEIYSGLIFHPHNVNKQCSMRCNNMLHGAEAEYRIGLVAKIGERAVKDLETLKDKLRQYKYTKEQLTEINQYYKTKIKNRDFSNDLKHWEAFINHPLY